jgi:hypothetical protein
MGSQPFLRLTNADDIREDLELAVLELQDRLGVATRSIRKYVNDAMKATEHNGVRATPFLRKRWAREQEPSEDPSRPIGNAESSPRTAAQSEAGAP